MGKSSSYSNAEPVRVRASAKERRLLLGSIAVAVLVLVVGGVLVAKAFSRELMVTHGIDWSLFHIVSGDPCVWAVQPNLDAVPIVLPYDDGDRTAHISTNALGLRSPPLQDDPDLRVLAIGDSTTFGLGVENDETWPHYLGQALSASGRNVEVLNGGTSGYTSIQGLCLLDKHGDALQPGIVIATFGNNDSHCWDMLTDRQRTGQDPIPLSLRAERFMVSIGLSEIDYGNCNPRVPLDSFREALGELQQWCIDRDAKLVLIRWADRAEIEYPDQDVMVTPYGNTILDFAQTQDVPYIDLRELIESAEAEARYLDGTHIDGIGNERLAAVIAERLRRAGLVSADKP